MRFSSRFVPLACVALLCGGRGTSAALADSIAAPVPVSRAAAEAPVDAPRPATQAVDGPVSAPRPKPSDFVRPIVVSPQQIPELIDRLDSDEYRDRQQATRLLKEAGAAAVDPLTDIALSGSLEAAVRAIRILQAIYVGGDEAAVDAAEAALDRLKRADNPSVAARAEAVLAMNYDVRERRALAEIQRLGGVVKYMDHALPDPRFPDMLRHHIQAVILGKTWRGGDAGLKHIRRLSQLPMLYIVDGTGAVSEEAERQLMADMPDLRIQHRSRARLGVGGNTAADGCVVTQVEPGSAAARAGIQEGDVVTQFGGKPVADFESMVKIIYDYEPGDRAKVEIDRRGRTLELEVVMDGWTDLEASAVRLIPARP